MASLGMWFSLRRVVMGIGEFLLWIDKARVDDRCEAARSIARTVLRDDLELDERCMAEAALALLLDDPSPKVRRALADVLSLSARAPQQLLHALALDQLDVAAPVLARSPLSDDTLIERLKKADAGAAALIADRPKVSNRLALAIAELADATACLVLLTNTAARCDDAVFARMIARHAAGCAELRGAMSLDPRLSLTNRQKVVDACAAALGASRFVSGLVGACRAAQIRDEACADAPLILIEHSEPEALGAFVDSLRDAGRLTSGLIMKALVFGRIDFVATVLADLSHRAEEQVRGVLVRGGENAIRALLKDVGLKGLMLELAWRALDTWRLIASGKLDIGSQELAWQLMRHAEQAETGHENDDLAALMRKIYLEIARANAHAHARDMLVQAKNDEQAAFETAQALETEIAHLLLEMDAIPALDDVFDTVFDGEILTAGDAILDIAPEQDSGPELQSADMLDDLADIMRELGPLDAGARQPARHAMAA